jgi:hypothetical protein
MEPGRLRCDLFHRIRAGALHSLHGNGCYIVGAPLLDQNLSINSMMSPSFSLLETVSGQTLGEAIEMLHLAKQLSSACKPQHIT